MKKTFLLSLFLFSISITIIDAKIIEIKNISEISKYAKDENTLVVFDIDNTILEPDNNNGYGSDQWFSALVKNKTDKGLDTIPAIEMVLPEYFKAHETIKVKPVEENETLKIIKQLQKQKIHVMALSARSFPMIDNTFRQFKEMNIDLTQTSLSNQTMNFKKFKFPAKYNKGILFIGNNNKGKLLKTYLSSISFEPSKIVMIDDKEHHLKKIETEFKGTKISFIGLRYAFLDSKVKNFVLKNSEIPINMISKSKDIFSKAGNKVLAMIKYPFKKREVTV